MNVISDLPMKDFRFTHSKKSNGAMVGVLEQTKSEVTFAYQAKGKLYSLSEEDFEKRFLSLE